MLFQYRLEIEYPSGTLSRWVTNSSSTDPCYDFLRTDYSTISSCSTAGLPSQLTLYEQKYDYEGNLEGAETEIPSADTLKCCV